MIVVSHDSSLTTSTGSGEQTTTQDPQTSVGESGLGSSTSQVQVGTNESVLNSSGGIALGSNNSSAINLGATTSSTTAAHHQTVTQHQFNPVLVTLSILFFIIAVGLFTITFRSAKSTTTDK